ncbi:FG-GAP repeat domain-containing protein [Tautonia rosea]|uniref:FG-GAP repeat domain-containing protein n=1 Tax=Tautonia rosea TaxID=2728037 RepID=UPI00147526F9|nr:VCBS repeat-containing protein [Tautonia rosea]
MRTRRSDFRLEGLEPRVMLDANAGLIRFDIIDEPANVDWPSSRQGAPTIPLSRMMVTDVDGSLSRVKDVDVVRVDLKTGEVFVASLNDYNTNDRDIGTYRLRLLNGSGAEVTSESFQVKHNPFRNTVEKSSGPGSANVAFQNALSIVHQIEQTGAYYVELADVSGLGREGHEYSLGLRVIGLNDGISERGFLNSPATNHLFVSLQGDVLQFAGPIGAGFGLRGDWTQTIETSDEGVSSRYESEGLVFLRSAAGEIPIPIPPGMSFSVTTVPNRWGAHFGEIDEIDWTAQLGPIALAKPLTEALGFRLDSAFGSVTGNRKTYGLKLGRDELVQETNAPVNANIPYLFFHESQGLSANFGGIEAKASLGYGWSIVTDPSDVFLYAGVRGIPTALGEFALAGSLNGNIPYTPFAKPTAYNGTMFGHIYLQAEVDLTRLVGTPISVNGEVVIDFDANDDNRLLGGVFDDPSRFASAGFDPGVFGSSTVAALGDLAIGVNAEIRLGLKFGDNSSGNSQGGGSGSGSGSDRGSLVDLTIPIGEGSLIYDPSEDGFFVRAGSSNPFEDTFLEKFVPMNRVVGDGFIKRDGTFRLQFDTNMTVLGYRLSASRLTVQNLPGFSGVRASAQANVLGAGVNLSGEIKTSGDFVFTGKANVNLAGILKGNANVTFSNQGGKVSFRANLVAEVSTEIAGKDFGGRITTNIMVGVRGGRLTYDGSVLGELLLGPYVLDVGLRIYDNGNEFGLELKLPAVSIIRDVVGGFLSFFGLASPDIPDVIRIVFPRTQRNPSQIINVPPPLPGPLPLPVRNARPGDFDGDGKSDFGVYGLNPEGIPQFTIALSTGGTFALPFGGRDDLPVIGDFDGDGVLDFGVYGYSPNDGYSRVAILLSGGGVINQPFGGRDDLPVVGDYDGDGTTDIGVYGYSPNEGFSRFAVILSNGGVINQPFGGRDDLPVVGDYDGDGTTDIGVYGYSPNEGFSRFAVILSNGGVMNRGFGGRLDVPVAGDFDGDGKTDLAVHGFSPNNGFSRFAILPSSGAPAVTQGFGGFDDLPIAADFSGDGKTDFAVHGFSPADGYSRFAVLLSDSRSSIKRPFGAPGMVPLPPSSSAFLSAQSHRTFGQASARSTASSDPAPVRSASVRSRSQTPVMIRVDPIPPGGEGMAARSTLSTASESVASSPQSSRARIAQHVDAGLRSLLSQEKPIEQDQERQNSRFLSRFWTLNVLMDREV